jgi:surface antigen
VPLLFRFVTTLACMLLVGGLGVVAAAPASAVTYLCIGYADCRNAGYSHAGYAKAGSQMYWRMYAGHNCTNYAAYRMVRSGMANSRPWEGPGNATYWGTYNPGRTDTVPRVGAVAWWKANTGPAGSAGHVAYVERVVSPGEIIVSQDSWGWTFSWARITKGSGDWPSGFVHFNDAALRNTSRPTVSGEAKVGETLAAGVGGWSPEPARYRYQWRADGVDIAGATDATLRLGLEHEDKHISVRVTAAKLGYPATSALSARTTAVAPAVLSNTAAPIVTGDAVVDSTLTAYRGSWDPRRVQVEYQWLADGTPLPGATRRRFTPGPAHVGSTLAVRVTASKDGYRPARAVSEPRGPVAPGTLTLARRPSISGEPLPGHVLQVDTGSVAPAGAEPTIRWLRGGRPVAGATGLTYPVTAADLGSRIKARVRWTKPGYTSLTGRSASTRRVKATPRVRVRVERPTPRRLRIRAGVTAADVVPVTGMPFTTFSGRVDRNSSMFNQGQDYRRIIKSHGKTVIIDPQTMYRYGPALWSICKAQPRVLPPQQRSQQGSIFKDL